MAELKTLATAHPMKIAMMTTGRTAQLGDGPSHPCGESVSAFTSGGEARTCGQLAGTGRQATLAIAFPEFNSGTVLLTVPDRINCGVELVPPVAFVLAPRVFVGERNAGRNERGECGPKLRR